MNFQKINDLMGQEVSRKDFLRYVGAGILGVIGVSKIVSSLNQNFGSQPQQLKKAATKGYGFSAYGR